MGNEKAVLFIGTNLPQQGKDQEAMGLWSEAGRWLDSQQKAGFLDRWDGFWLTPHGGDLNGAFVCYGERSKLDEWRRTDAFEGWVFKIGSCMDGLGVVPGVNYAATADTMQRRMKAMGR
jgi:hypothetical protein